MVTSKKTTRSKRGTRRAAEAPEAAAGLQAAAPAQPGAPSPAAPPAAGPASRAEPADLRELIARRAYELYEAAGRPDGQAEAHWLQAEAEVLATAGRQASRVQG